MRATHPMLGTAASREDNDTSARGRRLARRGRRHRENATWRRTWRLQAIGLI